MAERKSTDEALRESEERFRRYFDLGLIGMATTSPEKGCIEVNDELCRILGYDREELLRMTWTEITYPDDLATEVAKFNRVMEGEMDGYALDKRWIRKDGRVVDTIMTAQCIRRADGSVDYFVGMMQDITERKRAEEKLKRSEIYMTEGQRLSHTASWAWNVSTGETFWSAELFRIYGLDPNEVTPGYPSVLTYIHADDRERVQQTFEDAVRESKGYQLAYRVVRADGTVRHVNNIAHPVFDKSGVLIEYVGTTVDTTERIDAEKKLRCETYLAEGQRISHTGSWARNVLTGELFWSEEHFRIFGLDPEKAEPSYKGFFEIVHPEDRLRVKQRFGDAMREKAGYESEYRIVLPDGTIRHIHALGHPAFNGSKAVTEYVGTVMDITERKKAEETVRKAHERIDLILASISDQFFALSKDWRFTYFNQHAGKQMKRLGKDPERLIGKVLWEEFAEVPNEAALRRVMSERVLVTDELYYQPLDEWVENHMYPSQDGGLVTFQRYITNRKRTEEELRKTRTELAHVARVSTLGELTASIAHEVNQPLGAVAANSSAALRLLGREKPDVAGAKEALECIIDDVMRSSKVVSRIRNLVKKTAPEKSEINIHDVISDVISLCSNELNEAGISLITNFLSPSPLVRGDRIQMQQVLLNLVLNAKEAMKPAELERRQLQISTFEGSTSEIGVDVADTGIGFQPEMTDSMFDPFYSTRHDTGGLGLGLSISRSIVENHDGRLFGFLNEDGGATFRLVLPKLSTT